MDTCGERCTREQSKGTNRSPLENRESHSPLSFVVAQKFFAGSPRYGKIISEAVQCDAVGMHTKAKILLESLPSERQLITELITKMAGKSVAKTLIKLAKEESVPVVEMLKGWSSFMTHVAIEIEHGNTEYRMLLGRLYEKIGSLIGEV